MPRKTKESNEEKNVKKSATLNEKINTLIKNVFIADSKEKPVAKSRTKKESTLSKVDLKEAKEESKRVTKKASEVKEKKAKKSTKSVKTTTAKARTKTAKKAATTRSNAKKSTKATIAEEVATKSDNTLENAVPYNNVEYYDLPYKYNQTVVKILYQNPTTLFVYWEISDADMENYKSTYGENFFETTRPFLVVYNDTMNYHFEIPINDFANSWYFNVNDSKCNYRVELIRKPVFYNEHVKSDVYISSSNKIESPNDKILFSTDEPYTVYFRNIKNNHQRKVNLQKLLERLNLANKEFGFPLIKNVYDLYKFIYHIDNIEEFSAGLNNPSSGNPSSHSFAVKYN